MHDIPFLTPSDEVKEKTGEITIQQRIDMNNILLIYKIKKGLIKTNLMLRQSNSIHEYRIRNHSHIRTHRYSTKRYALSITTDTVNKYNKLPKQMKDLSYHTFKLKLKYMLKSGSV